MTNPLNLNNMTNQIKQADLVITVAATGSYCYAMEELAERVTANLRAAGFTEPGVALIAGDDTKECKQAEKAWRDLLPENWEVRLINAAKEDNTSANYKPGAQIVIAKLRTAAFNAARRLNPKWCWSLDSDTLPPANALRCMFDMLRFDGGYYSVSTCPYPNEAFLGGRGTVYNPIAEDFIEKEKLIPADLQKEIDALKEEAATSKETQPDEKWLERKRAVEKRVKECPPAGNVWFCNDKFGWRRRGWFEQAYPGIGKGSVVPSDWCGFGCTLMNAEALTLANFDGYDGGGTEDLFVVWRRWYPAGLRINCISHCPCDHIIWKRKKGGPAGEYVAILSYHETEGECVGHLRTRKVAWPWGSKLPEEKKTETSSKKTTSLKLVEETTSASLLGAPVDSIVTGVTDPDLHASG